MHRSPRNDADERAAEDSPPRAPRAVQSSPAGGGSRLCRHRRSRTPDSPAGEEEILLLRCCWWWWCYLLLVVAVRLRLPKANREPPFPFSLESKPPWAQQDVVVVVVAVVREMWEGRERGVEL